MPIIAALAFLFTAPSFASTIPTGSFDCSKSRGSYLVEISNTNSNAYFLNVKHVVDETETELEGYALVVKQKSRKDKSFNLIRLPGSNIELHFDDEGNLGLDRGANFCKKMK